MHTPTRLGVETPDSPSAPVFLGHAARTIGRYRYPILLSLIGVALLYAVIALLAYLLAPSQRITSLPFRLEFEGAELGQYPNGTKFSSAELVGTPILRRVYDTNRLARFTSFKEFSGALFVLESNKALDLLAREYGARLSDPKLNPVDRERIEREYQLKRESIPRSEFSLNFASTRDTRRLPQPMIEKALRDTLAVWARSAAEEKGVSRYRIPVLSRNVLEQDALNSATPLVALDVLRTRAVTISRNIDAMLTVPGAEVLRTPQNGVTLTELRLKLGDVVRFKIEPLIRRVGLAPDSAGARSALRYVEAQLKYNELSAQAATAKVEALRQALALYTAGAGPADSGESDRAAPSPNASPNVTPQITESFLDRLVELSRRGDDLQYRQELVDKATTASIEALPYTEEATYYRDLLQDIRQLPASSPAPAESAEISTQLREIFADIARVIEDVNVIYRILSDYLNTSTMLYSLTGPSTARIERAVSPSRLALWGLLVVLLAVPASIAGALLHNRIREEEQLEDMIAAESRSLADLPRASERDFSPTSARS